MATSKKLTANTVVFDDSGMAVFLNAGEAVPSEYADQVTNPAAYAEDPYGDGNIVAALSVDGDDTPDEGNPANPEPVEPVGPTPERPADSANKGVWVAYADAAGVTYADDATKAQIQKAVDDAGLGE